QDEHRLVRERRNPVFLHKELHSISHHLEESERSDAIWPVPVLPQGEQSPLEPDDPRGRGERNRQNSEDRQHGIGAGHVILTIFPHAGKSHPASGGTPAGRPATPRGMSGRMRIGNRNVSPPQRTSTFSSSIRSPALTATWGVAA